MEKKFIMIILVFLLSTNENCLAKEFLMDRLIAEVNGEGILKSEIDAKIFKGQLVEVSQIPAKENDDPSIIALNDLINLTLILQKAEELGISIDDEMLEVEIEKFLAKKGMPRAELMSALLQQGMTFEEYREDFRKQLILSQFQGRVIYPLVKISEKDAEVFFSRSSRDFEASQVKLYLRQIFFPYSNEATLAVKAAKLQLAEKVQREIDAGTSIADAAKLYSSSDGKSSILNGQVMPPIFLKDLAPEFRERISSLSEKTVTKPIVTGKGIYLFYLDKKELALSDEFIRQKEAIMSRLRQEEIVKQTIKWLELQRLHSKIQIIGLNK